MSDLIEISKEYEDVIKAFPSFSPYRVPMRQRAKKLRLKSNVPMRQKAAALTIAGASLAPIGAGTHLAAKQASHISPAAIHAPVTPGGHGAGHGAPSHGPTPKGEHGGGHGGGHEPHVPEREMPSRARRGVYNAAGAPPRRF